MRRSPVVLFLAGVLFACSRASTTERAGATTQAIQGGVTDTENRFALGVCGRASAPGECGTICSGALILPNVVATARHCVSQSARLIDCRTSPRFGPLQGGKMFVTTRTEMTPGGGDEGWYEVADIELPGDDLVCGNDIALLVLAKPVLAVEARPITPGVQYLMWDPAQYGSTFTAIGYGVVSPAGDDAGTRRRLDFVSVLCVPGSEDAPCVDGFDPAEFSGGDGICSGDSGSSAFERASFERGAPVSFGVLSRGDTNEAGTECVRSVYSRFDAHRSFVLDVAARASKDWTLYPEPDWTAPKPPPIRRDAAVEASAPEPAGLPFGSTCTTADACTSHLCVAGNETSRICSQACLTGATCPGGYDCRTSACLPALPPPLAATAAAEGCASGGSSPAGSAGWSLVALLACGALRRRKE